MSDEAAFVGRKVKHNFDSFWDYVNEVEQYAIEITEGCSSSNDLPLWNKLLVFAYCAATWNYERLTDEMFDEYLEERDREARSTEKINAANERAALKRKIRSLQKQLARAKEKATTKKSATINKE